MIGQSVGSDASRLSCFLFRPRKSCKKCRKRSHTNVSNTLVTRPSTPPAQTATFAFTSESGYTLGFRRKIAHSGSHAETGGASLRSCAEYLVAASSLKEQPEKVDARQWRVSDFSGVAAPQGGGTFSLITAWSFLHRYQSGQQLELSIKTIRRPNVHCKTECILLQYFKRSLEWRRYTICPLSLFATTSRK